MERLKETWGSMHCNQLREPLAIIRFLEIPFSILAFATTMNYEGFVEFRVTCDTAHRFIKFSYPFLMIDSKIPPDLCHPRGDPVYVFHERFDASAQFFVTVGFISFFYALIFLVVFTRCADYFLKDRRYAIADLSLTAIVAVLWFAAAVAWSVAVAEIKYVTDTENVNKQLGRVSPCKQDSDACKIVAGSGFSELNLSLVVGFCAAGLWAANAWLAYKESPWLGGLLRRTPPPGVSEPSGPLPVTTDFERSRPEYYEL